MLRISISCRFIAALAVAFVAVGPAQAQPDPNLNPTFGSIKLAAGFLPDPFTTDLQAGGQIRTKLGGVNAHVAKAPDFSLQYTKGKFPLSFTVKSAGDTTLLINLPDGTWIADDDSGGGLDPMIRIANPQSGRYDIYVGTYQKDLVAATLDITERDLAKKPPMPVNPNLPECFILSAGVDNYPNVNKLKGCLNDARNTVAAFKAQTGTVFRGVKERILLDGAATHGAIQSAFQGVHQAGSAWRLHGVVPERPRRTHERQQGRHLVLSAFRLPPEAIRHARPSPTSKFLTSATSLSSRRKTSSSSWMPVTAAN